MEPVGDYNFYAGIDPGFSGAIAVINADGTSVRVWDMPVKQAPGDADRKRELALDDLEAVFRTMRQMPRLMVGIEWPQTRPGEGAERSERYGRQKGILQAFLWLHRLPHRLVAPNLWKGRLSLPGKTEPGANRRAAECFRIFYREHEDLILGPRGGLKDGRIDALLIAHWLRTRSRRGMQSVVDKFGRHSQEVFTLRMQGSKKCHTGVKGC